ncbi:hypothetical protein OG727_21375 [Streptomyces caniferus]|uniref:DUF2637 domain-containing protein n=1 Tax=Streptomyces caniferus TaxID=285557 RepID=A0ABZ1VN17_9ACTN|nr:hypothetical protein [Streptomyces caniferus]
MSLSTYRQEQRADDAAKAEQRRLDASAGEERRAQRQHAADERAARLREQGRADREADRAARRQRRRERHESRAAALTPENIYRRGTLGLVTASGLASLPAQILHFVGISPLLLPLPPALEGAAWVMAAGVAYADARGLPGWVRWMLRTLVLGCAAFAAYINYGYGVSLTAHGLSQADAATVGAGLAAVTILGPAVFEIRQWVSTLAAAVGGAEERDRRRHAARRRRHHRKVLRVANRLVSAAPFGALPAEDAWARAWSIVHGCNEPTMTPDLHKQAAESAERMRAAQQPPTATENKDESADSHANGSTAELEESTTEHAAPVGTGSTLPAPEPVPVIESMGRPVTVVAAAESRPRRATGRVPRSARSSQPKRTPEQLLDEARSATADWSIEALTAEGIRKAVHTSPQKARVLRETLRTERTTATDAPAAEAA